MCFWFHTRKNIYHILNTKVHTINELRLKNSKDERVKLNAIQKNFKKLCVKR